MPRFISQADYPPPPFLRCPPQNREKDEKTASSRRGEVGKVLVGEGKAQQKRRWTRLALISNNSRLLISHTTAIKSDSPKLVSARSWKYQMWASRIAVENLEWNHGNPIIAFCMFALEKNSREVSIRRCHNYAHCSKTNVGFWHTD